ncbi:DUF4920 domain-containing protein [Catalinimonas niigatensis]|uniref:DUF4920 domain-containing protein n=1 Tax=Catalinimonas niigatensis TaxID=1397264 RepID=UPI002666870A|nr:DUF4920 domain-containing protein [Catalinimonas niigatensis]WPP53200.1 DUF4920 domain-containing protein [Catalinimonas niigatensis]
MRKYLIFMTMFSLPLISVMAQKTEKFGAEINEKGALQPVEFIQEMDDKIEQEVKFVGKVNEVCQMKGCWMTLDLENGEEVMVRFKDYAFFVPKNAGGKTAVVEGRAYFDEVSVETLRHYAEDAGKSQEEIEAITKPEMRLSFVADGVILREE